MKKKNITKKVLCFGLALTVAITSQTPAILATSLTTDTSLAGISLTLDKYCSNEETVSTLAEIEVQSEKTATPQPTEDVKATTKSVDKTASEDDTTTVKPVETEKDKEDSKESKKEEKKVSKYANVGISVANDYVNIRKAPNTDGKILGKLYRGAAAEIIATKGEWVKIKSGSVKGYIKSEFLAIGFDAEELEDKFATKWATIETQTLKVREKRSTESICITMVPLGETYEVIKEHDKWVKIMVDEGEESGSSTAGYVSKDYVTIKAEFAHAISIAEEQAELKRQEEAERALEEQQRQEELKKQQAAQSTNNSTVNKPSTSNTTVNKPSTSTSSSNKPSTSTSSSSNSSSSSSSSSTVSSSGSGTGAQIASFAQKFVGNPYVWGGTSLTRGADCSGFVQSVYKNFGHSLPRTSGSQSTTGTSVSVSNLQPGDLVFYAKNGSVNHVAIYIGGGRVCHASNKRTGITTSNLYYRQPHNARRIVG